MLWMVLIRSVKAVVVASELPQQNLMLFFANPQLSTLKCNSPSPLLAKVERRVYGRGGGKTTVCYYYFLLLPKSCGNASLWPSWWTKKNQIEMGWVVYSLDPLKKKYWPPKKQVCNSAITAQKHYCKLANHIWTTSPCCCYSHYHTVVENI